MEAAGTAQLTACFPQGQQEWRCLQQERRSVSKPVMSKNSILPIVIIGFNKQLLGMAGTLLIFPLCSMQDD